MAYYIAVPRRPAARKFVLSPTKIRTFRECPTQYRLEYVEKLGRFYHRPRAGFSFGSSLHRTLEVFHAGGGAATVTVEEMSQTLAASWVAQGYESPEQEQAYKAEAQQIVAAYHAAAQERAALPDAPPPATLLYAEKTLKMELTADVALSGRVDRVDEHADGSLEIVDYKSGRRDVTEEDVAGALAMNLYQALLKNLHPDRRVFATIHALRTGAAASYELPDDAREALLAECAELGEYLRTKDWDGTLPVLCDHCPYCDFLPHCERYFRMQRRTEEAQ